MGIGLKCPEGVVIASDSAGPYWNELGQPGMGLFDKTFWLTGQRVAVITSGTFLEGAEAAVGLNPMRCITYPTADFPAVARQLYASLRQKHLEGEAHLATADPVYAAKPSPPTPQVLVAGGTGEPQLVLITPEEERWARVGDAFLIGAWTGHLPPDVAAEIRKPAPKTLAACKELVVSCLRRFIEYRYGAGVTLDQVLRVQHKIPLAWWPLKLTTIAENTRDEEINE